jgi:biofilm protein TabA
MIFVTLSQSDRYASLHPLLPQALTFIRNTDLFGLSPGRYPILGESLFLIAETAAGRSRSEAQLECHRRYIDVHLVLEGLDEIGWKPVDQCREPVADYSAERDIQFFRDIPTTWIPTPPGALCILFPEDAHAPLISSGMLRKAVLKIEVEGYAGRTTDSRNA